MRSAITATAELLVTYPSYSQVSAPKQPLGYHSNGGRSGVNFSGTVKLYNLYNPLFGETFMFLFLILANFVLKFPHFPCHGNKGRSGVNFNDTE